MPRHEVTRRDALKLLAAGIAALEAGCLARAGDEEIVPYVVDPPEQRPGASVRYASVLAQGGFGAGVIAETREGRPIKLDGNPAHPATAGGSTPWLQASILDLYDPQRTTVARDGGVPTTWAALARRLRELPDGPLWLVLPPQSSPTLGRLLRRLRVARELRVVFDAPLDHRAAYRGAALALGRPLEVQLDLSRADVVLALDADVLAGMPMSPAWARAAAARRDPGARMSRIWACEPMPTPTGALADERLAIRAGDVACVAACLVAELDARGLPAPPLPAPLIERARRRLGPAAAWARAAAADLAAHPGAGAVIAGDRQPPVVHALARWIDHACRNTGGRDAAGPVALTEPALLAPLGGDELTDLAAALRAGDAAAVIVIDADPVYTAPRALALGEALAAAPFSLHLGLRRDRTAAACRPHAPLAHPLEAWGDARAWDGTLAIAQPLIRPRFDVASPLDALAALLGEPRGARALVRETLGEAPPADPAGATPGADAAPEADGAPEALERALAAALRAGVVPGTRAAGIAAEPTWPAGAHDELARALAPDIASSRAAPLELALAPSPSLGDGRGAANAWLQELPHPITKQAWGNAALMSRATAARLGVADEDLVQLATAAGRLELPALVVDGAADGSITVEVGYGQVTPDAPVADRVGADAYALRRDDRRVLRATARRVPGARRVIRTQRTMTEHGRDVAPHATRAQLAAAPDLVAHLRGAQASLLPPQGRGGVQWGMSIDTSICTGCSACMVACQAENNIPTVGPDDVARGRAMHWIRVDRYVHEGGVTVNEPMPCQHCEDAPCEYVCPVMATTHSPDGLNEQIYNRCVGTRFCSNNCPYKVRRFNWFDYERQTSRALQHNPDVTVRSRGVMEKCTYCVQRIRRAEHQALVEKRALRAGEVVTACQAACPTGAIQFGQLDEQGTPFARLRRDERRFDVLHDLGTRPRTQYLVKIRNPREGA